MSKCAICGNELLTGDVHLTITMPMSIDLCKACYNKTYKDNEQKCIDLLIKNDKEKKMNKCWYCNSELTTEDNPKHLGICNKCYDEMFKSGDMVLHNLTNKIAELQNELANTQKEYQEYREVVTKDIEKEVDERMRDTTKEFHLDIQQLQKQLEEKEKTIQGLIEAQKYLEQSASYQMFLDVQNQIENYRKATKELRKEYDERIQENKKSFIIAEGLGVRIEKLEQQLKSQPKEIVEKIRKELETNGNDYCEIRRVNSPHTNHSYAWFNYVRFRDYLDTILKEYVK